MLGGYTPGLVETSIADDGLAMLSGDRQATVVQGNTQLWYRTGASGQAIIGDNMGRGNTNDKSKQARTTTDDRTTDTTMDDANQRQTSRREVEFSSTYDLITKTDRPNLEGDAQSERADVLLSTSDTEDARSDVDLRGTSLDPAVTVSMSGVILDRRTQVDTASGETLPKPVAFLNDTLITSEITSTQQQIEPTVILTPIQDTGDHMTTIIAGQRSNINVTDDHRVSGQLDENTIVFSSDIPQTTEDASRRNEVTLSDDQRSESGYNLDLSFSDHRTTDIPEQFGDTTEQQSASVERDAVTADTVQIRSTTPTARKPDLIPCSTKHRSKTKKQSHQSKPSRRRNRNKKRTRLRTAQTSAPPSLSMGYGIDSTQKYPPNPLPNPYHPQVHVTQPSLISSADHSFARNSTFTISGLSSGEVTGIAIGCIIAFWIILGPLVCIICRMRDRAKEKRREREQEDSMSHTLIEEMIRMELARGRAKLYRTNVDDEREIERLPLQADSCNTCNSNGSCVINPQDYVIGNRYMEYTPVSLMPAPPSDSDKDYIINKTYMDSLEIKSSARDTNL